jgi:hypothetical protein
MSGVSVRRCVVCVVLAGAAFLAPPATRAFEIPEAVVVLESLTAALPDQVAESAPPRFVLMEDGTVFVGGTRQILTTKLAGRDLKDLDRRLADVRKLPALAGTVTLGPGRGRYRMLLRKGRPLLMTIEGDPAQAAPAVAPLGALLYDLLRFDHAGLREYQPTAYAMSAREQRLPGGCRPWPFGEPVDAAVFAPKPMAASRIAGWPTGASPAAVCVGDRAFSVTFRPLLPTEVLPGERP